MGRYIGKIEGLRCASRIGNTFNHSRHAVGFTRSLVGSNGLPRPVSVLNPITSARGEKQVTLRTSLVNNVRKLLTPVKRSEGNIPSRVPSILGRTVMTMHVHVAHVTSRTRVKLAITLIMLGRRLGGQINQTAV